MVEKMNHYIQQKQQKKAENQINFYTPKGIHVYIKEPVDGIDIQSTILKLE